MNRILLGLGIVASLSTGQVTYAQGVLDCTPALVRSTATQQSSDSLDWRLAVLVDESTYNELKKDASVSATIYGIPMGANYAEFQKNYATKRSAHNESLTTTQARNVAWTGLDPNGASAYATCVQSQVFSTRGLHMAVKGATATDISIAVNWLPQGRDTATIKPTWIWDDDGSIGKSRAKNKSKSPFPTTLTQGFTVVVLKRPSAQQTFGINFPGYGDSVTLSPLPVPPIKDPVVVREPAIVDSSPPTNSGRCGDFGSWAQLCTTAKPAGWSIVDHEFSLTGDRAGCRWAECQQVSVSPIQVCYRFRMQGHSEECGSHGNTGIHDSTGNIRVIWAHPQ